MKNPMILALTLMLSTASAHASIRENGGFIVPSAAVLEFFSPGNGIDTELKESVKKLISQYEEAGQVFAYTEQRAGMEGETTICVQLKELEASRALNMQLARMVKSSRERKTNLKFESSCKN